MILFKSIDILVTPIVIKFQQRNYRFKELSQYQVFI